jgi:hypothetical protein
MQRLVVIGLLLATAGCGSQAVDPQVLAERERFLLTTEPPGAASVLDTRETLAAPAEVVLVGQIGGLPNPWTEGRAMFVIADPTILAELEDHECGEGCPHCAKHKQDQALNGLARIQFLDASGQPLPIDARRLFELQVDQTVVVCGQAHVDALGCLVVSASGIYLRR